MLDQLIEFIRQQIENNELFKGGLLLMVGGALLALTRGWPGLIWSFIKRQAMVVIDIPDRDQAFNWVNLWLAEHNYSKHRARLLTVATERTEKYDAPKIIFSPAPGNHWMFYKNRLMILSRERQQLGKGDTSSGPLSDPFREYFTIKIIGRSREAALQLINDAYELACPHTIDKVTIHRARNYGDWTISSWVPNRSINSVILHEGLMTSLINDIKTFKTNEQYYLDRGIPYRRGYLFYGPPGNGKTSAALAMATTFNMDIGLINIKGSDMSDDDFADALANTPKETIVLIEDIDCIAAGRQSEGSISFSGLLNSLDGLAASHGQIVIMTTNHREQLDEALIRPGRCDVQMEFTNADTGMAERMFERFFPGSGLAYEFSNRVPNDINMATLQQHMMMYRDNPREALQRMS